MYSEGEGRKIRPVGKTRRWEDVAEEIVKTITLLLFDEGVIEIAIHHYEDFFFCFSRKCVQVIFYIKQNNIRCRWPRIFDKIVTEFLVTLKYTIPGKLNISKTITLILTINLYDNYLYEWNTNLH